MLNLNEQYITDRDGNRTAVVISISKFEELQERLTIKEDEPDCDDVTDAINEGLEDVKTGQTVAMEDLLNALRD
jgi:PHD/YefM family antitoxin component YafN of YafNO toxin-antitoxin module